MGERSAGVLARSTAAPVRGAAALAQGAGTSARDFGTLVPGMRAVFALSFFQRLRGLLGRSPSWLGVGGVLLLAPCDSIHTWGMRYAIDVAFLDGHGRVLESVRRLPPRRRLRCPGARVVLERPSAVVLGSSLETPLPAQERWLEEGDCVFVGVGR